MAVSVVFQTVVGLGLLLFGWWARVHADAFCPSVLPPPEQVRRRRVVVRGSWACQIAGVVFLLMIVPLFVR